MVMAGNITRIFMKKRMSLFESVWLGREKCKQIKCLELMINDNLSLLVAYDKLFKG